MAYYHDNRYLCGWRTAPCGHIFRSEQIPQAETTFRFAPFSFVPRNRTV
ncbi:MAG: hypothetical protein LKF96_07155 [Treponema sp.]|nr:hypothetical protein [Treponema sp.]